MSSSVYQSRFRLVLFALGCAFVVWMMWQKLERTRAAAPGASVDQTACHGGKLGTPAAREQAMEDGYDIDRRHDCISRASYEVVQRQQAQHTAARQRKSIEEELAERRRAAQAVADASRTLTEARRGFQTAVQIEDARRTPLPQPPAHLYQRSDYASAGRQLAAFVSASPKDGKRHPAIAWLTGGDSNSLGDFWVPGRPGNDQSAQAFREAGVVMMFPTLRGGNTNPGAKELGLGEVEDVLAAAEHLAQLPYVDPQRIYLGGHSTGGTLALLVAETSPRFAAVLALGPVADVRDYGNSFGAVNWSALAQQNDEVALRSPGEWLRGIRSPTYLIEGQRPPGNGSSLNSLCAAAKDVAAVRCLSVSGHDHFSVVQAVARVAAAQILFPGPNGFELRADQLAALPNDVASR